MGWTDNINVYLIDFLLARCFHRVWLHHGLVPGSEKISQCFRHDIYYTFTLPHSVCWNLAELAENTVLAELLWEKNIVPAEKNKLNSADYKVSRTEPCVEGICYLGGWHHSLELLFLPLPLSFLVLLSSPLLECLPISTYRLALVFGAIMPHLICYGASFCDSLEPAAGLLFFSLVFGSLCP